MSKIHSYLNTLNDIGTVDLRGWYKAILKKEAGNAGYTSHQIYDQFERVTEEKGEYPNTYFGRSMRLFGTRYRWEARFGYPFVTVDNGWGVSQRTGNHTLIEISRWKNNVLCGYRWLVIEKYRLAMDRLRRLSGLQDEQIPEEVKILETVQKYNGGHYYTHYNKNTGQFSRQGGRAYADDIADIKENNNW